MRKWFIQIYNLLIKDWVFISQNYTNRILKTNLSNLFRHLWINKREGNLISSWNKKCLIKIILIKRKMWKDNYLSKLSLN